MALANALSLIRIPLGVAFLFAAHDRLWAATILLVAGASDVLDGWAARRVRGTSHEPHAGDWLDPLCDKLFVGAAVVGLYLAYRPPIAFLLLVVTREILQGLSLIVYKAVPGLRHRLDYQYRAHPLGKATTILQFLAAGAFAFEIPTAPVVALGCAVAGVASVAIYLLRARSLVAPSRPAL